MSKSLSVRTSPDGSLWLFQDAAVQRAWCFYLGFAAMVVSVILTFNEVPLNDFDTPLLALMFGFFFGALAFPSTFARFDTQTQTLSWQRDQWGVSRERTIRFSEIESIKRTKSYKMGKTAPEGRFQLVVEGRELPLLSGSLRKQRADELESRIREILPDCPLNPPTQSILVRGDAPLSQQNLLHRTPEEVLILRRSISLERNFCFIAGGALAFLEWGMTPLLEALAKMAFALTCLALFAIACILQEREWRFDPQREQLTLLKTRIWGKKQCVFDFADVGEVRRESHIVKPEDGEPYERFRLFLHLGEANETFLLSPKDLTLAQVDELERAVRYVLTPTCLDAPHME